MQHFSYRRLLPTDVSIVDLTTFKDQLNRRVCPRPNAVRLGTYGKRRLSVFPISAVSRLQANGEWEREGKTVKKGEKPLATRSQYGKQIYLFADWQIRPKRTYKTQSPQLVDLLTAIFTVNRAAKRFRDSASKLWRQDLHALCQIAKQKKIELYKLKNRGIIKALSLGLLSPCAITADLMLELRGGDFCFHFDWVNFPDVLSRDLIDVLPKIKSIAVESKPKGKTEAKLKDAIFTLEQI